MKKLLVILILGLAGGVLAIAVWYVATGRGLWGIKSEPPAEQAKQPEARQPEVKQPEVKQPASGKADMPPLQIPAEALKAAQTDANIVALISDYVITKDELEKELMKELQPYDYGGYSARSKPPDANKILKKMLAEKAMMLDGRKNGVLETEMTFNTVKRYRDRQLVNRLMQEQVGPGAPGLTISEAEIAEKMKADPKLDRTKAEQAVKRAKANTIMSTYYAGLYRKSNVKKATANFAKAMQIHERLLLHPIAERKLGFIRNSQIRDELTEAEKNILMATFNGGKVTLKNWFEIIGEIAPPYRPRDLNTEAGVDRLLERALKTPILVAEAVRLRLDEDETFRKQVRIYEDRNLLGIAKQTIRKGQAEPNDAQIKTYFETHGDEFRKNRKLKVDQIWCLNLKAAQAVKAELDEGKDFAAVKERHTLDEKKRASNIYPDGEAYFWPDLWKGEPNTVVGPLKGMYGNEFKWRIVKILEKHPGEIPQFSEKLTRRVKRSIMFKRRIVVLEQYERELLKKYTHKIYADRIKDINPLEIP